MPYGATKCPKCGNNPKVENAPLHYSKPFISLCERCGSTKGRLIQEKDGTKVIKSYYNCYDCHNSLQNEDQRGLFISEKRRSLGGAQQSKYWSQEELEHQRDLVEYYLKPLFYHEKPTYDRLEKSGRSLAKVAESNEELDAKFKYWKDYWRVNNANEGRF